MYLISITMNFKLFYRVTIRIKFVKNFIQNHPKYMSVKILSIFWGDIAQTVIDKDKQAKLDRQEYLYCVLVALTIFFIQCWKTTKWFEIRFKT